MIPDCTRCKHSGNRHMDAQHELGHCRESDCPCAAYTAADLLTEPEEEMTVFVIFPNGVVRNGVPMYVNRDFRTTESALLRAIQTLEAG